MSSSPARLGQTLLIDADDTLWENNIYFERAVANFISFLDHNRHSPAEVREILNNMERESISRHGYGLGGFVQALIRTFEALSSRPLTEQLEATIHGFAHAIAEHPVEILPGVEETLVYLARRHRLILVTKGAREEQARKLERSGLGTHFAFTEIVPEKNLDTYLTIIAKYDLAHASTWMVGNSPRSDINPALSARLNAIFLPHGNTWVLEHDELTPASPPAQLLVLESFSQLRDYF
jgi:putative hydrolase of the HAD superfamily